MMDVFGVNVDPMALFNLKSFSAKIVERAPKSSLKNKCLTIINESLDEKVKSGW